VETAETAGDAIASYERKQPDLVVLDLNLPDGDGFEVVRRIREHSGTPIIVLSARGGETDKVNALDLGADDYMTKPFGIDELLARIRVALRHVARPGAGTERRIRSGDLVIDVERASLRVQVSLRGLAPRSSVTGARTETNAAQLQARRSGSRGTALRPWPPARRPLRPHRPAISAGVRAKGRGPPHRDRTRPSA